MLQALLIAAVVLGAKPPVVELSGDKGGRVDGAAWSSSSVQGKVHVLFYVDPDEKDVNADLEAALKEADFPKDRYGSIAVINMDATWLPNAAIASSLKSKQEQFPDVTYVKDLDKALVKQWKLQDDAYVVLVFDKAGNAVYQKAGKHGKDDVKAVLDTVRKHLDQ